jgi:hypothetical protein
MALVKSDETDNPAKSRVFSIFGPGLITGASDDVYGHWCLAFYGMVGDWRHDRCGCRDARYGSRVDRARFARLYFQ